MDLNLKLNVNQVNTILRCLYKHPFEEAASLINTIQQQAQPQVNEQEEAAKKAAEEAQPSAESEGGEA